MNGQAAVAKLFFAALADAGVREVVISPGSRSTPFVWAASSEPRLACRSVMDERSAGFFALGIAKVSGAPVALLCTSGSAAAHYHPALVEATHAFVPLIVLTADRPLSLQSCGSSQTIDQVRMFGAHARAYVELDTRTPSRDALRAVRRAAVQAVGSAFHPLPGPVHVNLRAEKPLEPGETPHDVALLARELEATPVTRARVPRLVPDDETVRALAERIAHAPRGFVVCGPAPLSRRADADAVRDLARRTGYAVLAEATSQLRFVGPERETWPALDAFDLVLGSAAAESTAPDLVLSLGAAPISSAFDRWLGAVASSGRGAQEAGHVVVGAHGWADPQSCASEMVQADVRAVVDALLEVLPARPADEAWLSRIAALDRAAWEAVSAVLETGGQRSEGAMTRALVSALPRGALLAVSNSLPVRHLDAFVPGAAADVRVLSQRGAAGIDGIVSGAVGAAGAASVPTALLIGDLALLHDLSGLELARRVPVPFVIVVLNNDGGRIFEQLPVARAKTTAPLLDRWTTPHGLGFEHAAALFGHRYARVEHARDLASSVREAIARDGCTLIEARVDPHGAAVEHARLRARVEASLSEVG